MACKTESKQIGDHEYSVTQWPATKALLMKARLAKVFGASIAMIGAAAMGKSRDDSKDAKALADGLESLFNNNSPEALVGLFKESIIGVACDGNKITESSFEELFSGDNLLDIYKVFLFVVKVNYGNLVKGQSVDNLLANLKEKFSTQSNSQT